jgi:hypothetical protein
MDDFVTEGAGFASPETLFLILILLLTGTLGGGGKKRRHDS